MAYTTAHVLFKIHVDILSERAFALADIDEYVPDILFPHRAYKSVHEHFAPCFDVEGSFTELASSFFDHLPNRDLSEDENEILDSSQSLV